MWSNIREHFDQYPAQKQVAMKMLEHGIGTRDGRPCCGDITISWSALARATGTDRRVVMATIETISNNKMLENIFSRIEPACSYKRAAPLMGWGVLEILPEDVNRPGILASITGILAKNSINIRQVMADDPDMSENPKAFIITEKPIPGGLLRDIKELPGINSVTIY